eukprot:13962101-Heterocapsa_arctica.AAC.1
MNHAGWYYNVWFQWSARYRQDDAGQASPCSWCLAAYRSRHRCPYSHPEVTRDPGELCSVHSSGD